MDINDIKDVLLGSLGDDKKSRDFYYFCSQELNSNLLKELLSEQSIK